jgi:hypothetical protein
MHTAHALHEFSLSRQFAQMMRIFREWRDEWFYDDIGGASQSMALKETYLPRLLTLTTAILSGGVVLFILWAALTPVKELARTEGQVLPAGYSQLVQHLEGGLVRAILVQEGDFVQKDQVLIRLDGAGLEEDFHEQQALVQALSLQSERLHALLEMVVRRWSVFICCTTAIPPMPGISRSRITASMSDA